MSRKKILIVNPTTLFPITMMSHVRTINMIKRLSQDHEVDVAVLCRSSKEKADSREGLKDICRNFYPITPVNPKDDIWSRKYYGLKHKLLSYLLGVSTRYASLNNKRVTSQLLEIIEKNRYDVVQVEYWYLGAMFPQLPEETYKVIDSIAMVEENIETVKRKEESKISTFFKIREYKRSIKLQYKCFKKSDLVLSISRIGMDILKRNEPGINTILMPIGQDIDYYAQYKTEPEEKTIVFFGTLGSQQNTRAFSRLWNTIMPILRKRIPDIKLLVVGANPPEDIKKLHDGEHVVVTGFVDDPREFLAKANVMIIPLETGSGFRGRLVEVMAMGIPVVGTHNALDSIDMTHGVHGFISDSDTELADAVIRMIEDPELRQKISRQGMKFVSETYSNEATVGKLSRHYKQL